MNWGKYQGRRGSSITNVNGLIEFDRERKGAMGQRGGGGGGGSSRALIACFGGGEGGDRVPPAQRPIAPHSPLL